MCNFKNYSFLFRRLTGEAVGEGVESSSCSKSSYSFESYTTAPVPEFGATGQTESGSLIGNCALTKRFAFGDNSTSSSEASGNGQIGRASCRERVCPYV